MITRLNQVEAFTPEDWEQFRREESTWCKCRNLFRDCACAELHPGFAGYKRPDLGWPEPAWASWVRGYGLARLWFHHGSDGDSQWLRPAHTEYMPKWVLHLFQHLGARHISENHLRLLLCDASLDPKIGERYLTARASGANMLEFAADMADQICRGGTALCWCKWSPPA